MDERSQHGHQPHSQSQPHPAAPTPWPSYAAPQHGAPIHGHAPYPGPAPAPHHAPQHHAPQHHAPVQPQQQLPTMQQFQYAANGYVLPGATPAHGAPMSAHGGTIGMPMQAPQHMVPQPMAQPPAHAQHAVMGGGAGQAPAPALHPHANAQPQSWAFPTPHGMQLVQPGTTVTHVAHHGGMSAAPMARRMRWETIVPIIAVLCLIGAIALFMHDFDRITGRDAATATSSRTIDMGEAGADDGSESDGAGAAKDAPATTAPAPAAKVVASPREVALRARLGVERRDRRWTAVITTIGQLEKIRPLDRQLVSLRTRARAAAKASARKAAAAKAAAAAAAKRSASPSNQGARGGGGHAGHATPPVAGGNKGASTGARPPADVPKGSIPAVPNVPNPSAGGATGGAAAVGGGMPAAGSGSNCHTHDGVTSCHD